MRHRRRDCSGFRIGHQPVYALIHHAVSRLHVRRRVAVIGRRRLNAESGKAAFIAGFMQHARRMHRVVHVAHEEQRLARLFELLQRGDDAAYLLHARRLFLGRGLSYPIALEGALKFKELTYLHAEGYPAGEMKHGPLALVENGMPVIVIAPKDRFYEKTISNMQEVIARGGKILLISDHAEEVATSENIWSEFRIPKIHKFLSPFLSNIPLQLLAYYVALKKGNDIDKPRNLAKSVTVE